MRASLEEIGALRRKLVASVPSASLETELAERIKRAAAKIKLPGFRAGKVPLSEVTRRYGDSLRAEVAEELVRSSLAQAVEERQLALAGQAEVHIDVLEPGRDLEYTATFEVMPEFELAELAALELRRPEAAVTDAEVDSVIDSMRRQRATWQDVQRAAEAGDRVTFDVLVEFDGARLLEREADTLILAAAPDDILDDLHKAIEAHLHGAAPGDAVRFVHAPAGAAQSADGEGARAEWDVQITLRSVEQADLPALDEALLDSFSIAVQDGEDCTDALRAAVRERMAVELDGASRRLVRSEVVEALVRSHDFEIPAALLQKRLAEQREELRRSGQLAADDDAAGDSGATGADDAAEDATDADDAAAADDAAGANDATAADGDELVVPPEWARQAVFDVRASLVLDKVIRAAGLEVDNAKVRQRIDAIASRYEESPQVRNFLYSERNLARIESEVLEEQVVEHVMEQVRVRAVQVPFRQLVAAQRIDQLPGAGEMAVPQAARTPDAADAPTPDAALPGPADAAQADAGDDDGQSPGLIRRLFSGRSDR